MNDLVLRVDEAGAIGGVVVNGSDIEDVRDFSFHADANDGGIYEVSLTFYVRGIRTADAPEEAHLAAEDEAHPLRKRLAYLGEDEDTDKGA